VTVLTTSERSSVQPGLAPAYAAARAQLGLVVVLLALAGAGWWWTVREMRGMDAGPWSGLGGLGWFVGLWVVMMAAMMLPAVAPTIALYSRMTRQRSPVWPFVFTAGYLLTWGMVGLLSFGVGKLVTWASGTGVAWSHAGRELAGAAVIAAAVYQLTPLKDACLGRCRSPLGLLLGTWREGPAGALRMGAKNGAWCVGCCGALMVALFALGVMSIEWTALLAGLITVEKTLPAPRVATYATAALLLVLGILVLADPAAIPGLTMPHSHPMGSM
jgi:predicted metal-binding membrane protein